MDAQVGESGRRKSYTGAILPANTETFGGQAAAVPAGQRSLLSGSRVVLVLLLMLAVVAVLVPWRLQRPVWVEAEAVLGAWWLLLAVALSSMLYAGVGLRDDLATESGASDDDRGSWWDHLAHLDFSNLSSGADEAGFLVTILAIVCLGLLVLLLWVVFEVVAVLALPLGYALVWRMLTGVVHHYPASKGDVPLAFGLGIGWASAYTLPLVVAVALMHIALHV